MSLHAIPDAETVERLRLAYCEGGETIAAICRREDVSRRLIYRLRREDDWKYRHPAIARSRQPGYVPGSAAGPGSRRPVPAEGGRALLRRLQALIARRLAALEGAAPDDDPERAARALALNVRNLAALHRLTDGFEESDDTGPKPRTLAELRDELHRHLERIRHEREAARGPPPDEAHPA